MYEQLEHLYYKELSTLLQNMEDKEFSDWLFCESCTVEDYECLISALKKEEMYERINITLEYLNNL